MPEQVWNRMAVLTLACTVVGVFFWPALFPAIILWLLAMREKRRNLTSTGMGLATWLLGSLLGFIVVVALLIAWYRVPREIAYAKTRQEVAALNTMRAVRDALNSHKRQFGGYPRSVQTLVEKGLLDRGYLEPASFSYRFSYDVGDEIQERPGLYNSFAVFARPAPGFRSFGKRLYYLNSTGVIQIQSSMEAGDEIEQRLPPPSNWIAPTGGG